MKIEWNKVTWYSKLLALIMVATLPFIGFYLGMQYQKIVDKSRPASLARAETKVCKGESCITVEVADNMLTRTHGLMFREYLKHDEGMLFIFESESVYPFWMKNTLIPLDMIWMNGEGKVVYIKKNAEPCTTMMCPSINPSAEARYVLEVNAGVADEMTLAVEDMLIIKKSEGRVW